jgi:hypothetical protein
MKTTNPAERASSSNRVLKIVAITKPLDAQNPTEKAPESLAARKLSQRFGMPASTARLVAELAGLGPRDNREVVFPSSTIPQPLAGSLTHGA